MKNLCSHSKWLRHAPFVSNDLKFVVYNVATETLTYYVKSGLCQRFCNLKVISYHTETYSDKDRARQNLCPAEKGLKFF